MKANELRLNNYALEDGEIVKIVYTSQIHHAENLEPIPLTEEWLLKFGFEKNTGDNVVDSLDYELINRRKGIRLAPYAFSHGKPITEDGYLFIFRMDVGLDFEHIADIYEVHQLQNLYFSLVGEELTIKE